MQTNLSPFIKDTRKAARRKTSCARACIADSARRRARAYQGSGRELDGPRPHDMMKKCVGRGDRHDELHLIVA